MTTADNICRDHPQVPAVNLSGYFGLGQAMIRSHMRLKPQGTGSEGSQTVRYKYNDMDTLKLCQMYHNDGTLDTYTYLLSMLIWITSTADVLRHCLCRLSSTSGQPSIKTCRQYAVKTSGSPTSLAVTTSVFMQWQENDIRPWKFSSQWNGRFFPANDSHYLSATLSIRRMYDLYVETCASVNEEPVKHWCYKELFNTKCNLSFHQPRKDTAGYLRIPVDRYVQNPLRCYKRQRFGHGKAHCRCEQACVKCGQVGHDQADCQQREHCINCNGSHTAASKNCPK